MVCCTLFRTHICFFNFFIFLSYFNIYITYILLFYSKDNHRNVGMHKIFEHHVYNNISVKYSLMFMFNIKFVYTKTQTHHFLKTEVFRNWISNPFSILYWFTWLTIYFSLILTLNIIYQNLNTLKCLKHQS